MSKESLAKATNSSNLEMEEGVIHDVDRLAAAAGGITLGGLLLRYKDGDQKRWGKRIILILARRMQNKFRLARAIANRVALVALSEFGRPHCVDCRGAREIIANGIRIVCDTCGGSGQRRWTNHERRVVIGTYGSRIDDAITDAHAYMSSALSGYLSSAAGKLA